MNFRMPSGAVAPPPAENGGVPKTELQELQMKAGQVTDDVSTYRITCIPI